MKQTTQRIAQATGLGFKCNLFRLKGLYRLTVKSTSTGEISEFRNATEAGVFEDFHKEVYNDEQR